MSEQKLDAVVPLTLADFERFRLLQRTLDTFMGALNTCWVVTADRDYAELCRRIGGDRYRVLSESELLPELRLFPQVKGWYRQQLIKLAIAERVVSDFYITFDADVLCVRPVHYADLIQAGRAPCFAHPTDVFPEWYRGSEKVLGMRRSGVYHNVTPAILSRAGVLQLQEYLGKRAQAVQLPWRATEALYYLSRLLPGSTPAWRLYLLRALPWTEYSLYYTYLESSGLFDRYHAWSKRCCYAIDDSVWTRDQFEEWDARRCFTSTDYFFCVVQSRTGIAPQAVLDKIEPFLSAGALR